MARARANGVEIEYDIVGDGPETVLMIMGLGGQMTRWPPALTARIAAEGFRVVVYDNRDVGLSTGFDAAGPADIAAVITAMAEGRKPEVPYLLDDMAADAAGLLDLERAPALGGSFAGLEPMGLFWALEPEEPLMRLVKRDVQTPFAVELEVLDGHEPEAQRLLGRAVHERDFLAPGVRREPVRAGRVRGTLFLPPGELGPGERVL